MISKQSYVKQKFISLAVFAFLVLLAGGAAAQTEEAETVAETPSRSSTFKHAINMCPGGLAFGIVSANYEYLFNPEHGMVIRFDYEGVPGTYTDANIEAKGMAVILNYRWHWPGELGSFYLGAFGRYRVYDGTGTLDAEKFEFTIPETTIGLNIGKRWTWDSGFNINLAFGYGYSFGTRTSDPSSPEIDAMLDKFEEEYDFINPFLGEFSIGYAF